jgi:hypothetical protein
MREISVVVGSLLLGLACGWFFHRVIFVNRVDGSPLACEYRCDHCGHTTFYESEGVNICTRCQGRSEVLVSPFPKSWW